MIENGDEGLTRWPIIEKTDFNQQRTEGFFPHYCASVVMADFVEI